MNSILVKEISKILFKIYQEKKIKVGGKIPTSKILAKKDGGNSIELAPIE